MIRMHTTLSQMKGWDNSFLIEEKMLTPDMSYILSGVILFVVLLRILSWLQFVYFKHTIKKHFSGPSFEKKKTGLQAGYILQLQQECYPDDINRLAIWVYDVQINMFNSLHNHALSGEGMSYETGLALIHPDDRDTYIKELYLLSSGSIEKATEFLRFYHHGKYEAYLFNAVALKSVLTGKVEKIIGTEENVSKRYTRLYE